MKKEETYQSIDQRINQSVRYYRIPFTVEKDTALNSLLKRIKEENPEHIRTLSIPVWIRTVAAVAAVVIIVFVSGEMTTRNIRNEEKVAVSFRLPDQSRVLLANESSVRFNKLFLSKIVNLKGKAYFEVKKGSTFHVKTTKGDVEVLGTRFTVDDKNDLLQVICFEGKVKATFGDKEVILVPGSGINFSTDHKQTELSETEEYPELATFTAEYSNTELNMVVKEMESFFGVEIENQIKQPRYFSGTLKTGNLETALSILTVSLQLEYKIQSDRSIVIINQKIQKK